MCWFHSTNSTEIAEAGGCRTNEWDNKRRRYVAHCSPLGLGLGPSECSERNFPLDVACWTSIQVHNMSGWTPASESLCAAYNKMHGQSNIQHVWFAALQAVLHLPLVGLGAWLLLTALLWMFPGPPMDMDAVGAQSNLIRREIRGRVRSPDGNQSYMFMFEFGMFFLDIVTDLVCVIDFAITGQVTLAAMQLATFLLPILVGIYLKKMHISNLCSGFVDTVSRGQFPTNNYLLALRTEKGFEAPLSLALQYHFLVRNTSGFSFWCMVISMVCSVHSLTKFAFQNFELGLIQLVTKPTTEVLSEEDAAGRAADQLARVLPPHSIIPPAPLFPPGISPPASVFPPGITPPAAAFHVGVACNPGAVLTPICVDARNIKDRE